VQTAAAQLREDGVLGNKRSVPSSSLLAQIETTKTPRHEGFVSCRQEFHSLSTLDSRHSIDSLDAGENVLPIWQWSGHSSREMNHFDSSFTDTQSMQRQPLGTPKNAYSADALGDAPAATTGAIATAALATRN
jgi:hypothetical protein